jgi:hypothetical protein
MNDQAEAVKTPPAVPALKPSGDLSGEIERAIDRQPLDRVRCVRVFGDYYRCNWWAPPTGKFDGNRAFDWAMATTHQVRKSDFLRATSNAGQLVIETVTRG